MVKHKSNEEFTESRGAIRGFDHRTGIYQATNWCAPKSQSILKRKRFCVKVGCCGELASCFKEMFRAAVTNDMLITHPMDGIRYTKPVKAVDGINFLTVGEQNKFPETAKRSHNYKQYVLLSETGLRTSEMIGLTRDSIDWKTSFNNQ